MHPATWLSQFELSVDVSLPFIELLSEVEQLTSCGAPCAHVDQTALCYKGSTCAVQGILADPPASV